METTQQPANDWPVMDAAADTDSRQQSAPKRRYRLLAGTHVEQVQIGVNLRGEPVHEDRVYRVGDIVESAVDLCKLHNAGGRNLAHRKFELVRDGEPETGEYTSSGPTFTWDPARETIQEFVNRLQAQRLA